jgi:hypothetical protein
MKNRLMAWKFITPDPEWNRLLGPRRLGDLRCGDHVKVCIVANRGAATLTEAFWVLIDTVTPIDERLTVVGGRVDNHLELAQAIGFDFPDRLAFTTAQIWAIGDQATNVRASGHNSMNSGPN